MAIRLRDIAKDLNLSTMTISKVLRGQTDVSAETKARVLKRMEELNYRPNITARSLRTGHTYTVGMVVPRLEGAFTPLLAEAISEVFRKEGYSLILASADGDAENEERETDLHLSRQVDALLFCLRDDASDLPQALREPTTPVVLIGHRPARVTSLSIGLRENEVGLLAAQHLLERRCRRIAYLRGRRTAVADQRSAGFRDAMREAGITLRPEWVMELEPHIGLDGEPETEFKAARAAVRKLIASSPRPDGIVCSTDLAAAGACIALREAGFSVPEQVQVMGVGNTPALCEPFGLTSLDLAAAEIGRRAARMALRLIQKSDVASLRSVSLSPAVVARSSTRVPS
ncbi:transcriptional regulator, LacI family [Bryocella elongata]|uniref:Transcriptional regulator, LacI family n=1 Tax=Bryocella elongata TaxID=863522 RepID=A0A1H5UTK5_9BACT|nr:LacI family DNA-binding transcriptional regulator [Bryocella elongata]SEF78310.1 transcriptional regulator, LacI family [Bryocella elongata]